MRSENRTEIVNEEVEAFYNDIEEPRGNRTKAKKKSKTLLIVFIILILVAAGGFVAFEYLQGLQLKGESEMSVNLGEEFVDPGVKSILAKSSGDVDINQEGDYTVEYSLFGKTVTRTVHVVDPSHLVLGFKGTQHQKILQGNPYIESGAFAIDNRTGVIDSSEISISGKVDTQTPGTYEVTYTVTSDNISKTAIREVEVVSEQNYGDKAKTIPVMMYHWIYTKDDVPENLDGNWILDTELEKHLKYLNENNYYYPSFAELRAWLDGEIELPEKSIILTFDDGKKEFLKYGKPLFEQYKVPVTSFMIGWKENTPKTKMKKYASEYIQFQSHTFSMHQGGTTIGYRGIIADKDKNEIVSDLKKAQDVVKNNDALAYPYGDCTEAAMDAVKETGIGCAFTTEIAKVKRGQDYRKLPRVRVFGDASFDSWKKSIQE